MIKRGYPFLKTDVFFGDIFFYNFNEKNVLLSGVSMV